MFYTRTSEVNMMEQPIGRKKFRSANFSEREVTLLCDLVIRRPEIVESKQTDSITWRRKEQEWQTIAEEFNSLTEERHRSPKCLRTKYEALKKEIRKKVLRRKIEISQNEDAVLEDEEYTDNEKKVLWLLSPSPREPLVISEGTEEAMTNADKEYLACQTLNDMKIEFIKVNENGETVTEDYVTDDDKTLSSSKILMDVSRKNSRTVQMERKRPLLSKSVKNVSPTSIFDSARVRDRSPLEEEFRRRERELKLQKLEAEVQSVLMDVELKKLEKEIKEATLRKVLWDS